MTTATVDATLPQLLFLSSRPPGQIRWTEEQVLRRIYERQRAGLTLTGKDVRREAPQLHGAAGRRFGSWTAALKVAGVKPPKVSAKRILLSRDYLIARLQEQDAAGLPVSCVHPLLRKYKSVVRRVFGSWATAREVAGVRPLKRTRKMYAKSFVSHTRESIIAILKELDAAGLPFSSGTPPMSGCWKALRRLFGSLPAALEAAGISTIRRKISCLLDKDEEHTARVRILGILRDRACPGLTAAKMNPEAPYTTDAERQSGAGSKTGKEAEYVRSHPLGEKELCTKREEYLNMLRERTRNGLSIAITHPEMQKYYSHVRRLFGSWSKAREAAGCPRLGRYAADEVLDAITVALNAERKPLTSDPDLRAFRSAAVRYFGTWQEAVWQAQCRQLTRLRMEMPDASYPKTREGIITLLQDHARKGLSLGWRQPTLLPYRKIAIRLFGSWGEAQKAAGYAVPSKHPDGNSGRDITQGGGEDHGQAKEQEENRSA